MARVLLPLTMLLSCGQVIAASAVNTQDPYQMIEQAAKKTFARFDADQSKIKADPNHLKIIIEQELLPYIDYKYAAYKVLGKYLNKTTKAQRAAFAQAFRGYLVSTYASAFTAYTHQKVSFAPAKKFDDEKFVNVAVQVIEAGRPPIKLSFKVRRLMTGKRKDKKPRVGDQWKAIDLVAEGISLLQSKQSEIGGLVQKEGIESVINMLNERAKASVEAQKASSK